MHLRRKLVVGNWKMNGSLTQLTELSRIAAAAREASGVDVAICPPFTLLSAAVARSGGLVIGGQDCHAAESGAHTGNISAAMLKEAGAKLVIAGHSERRADQGETDEIVRAKAETALRHGLQTIVCVGESEAERLAGRAVERVTAQLAGSLPELSGDAELVVAYEPIWAIGTGKTASSAQAQEMHAHIRSVLEAKYGANIANAISILYGGSVKVSNAVELFSQPDVDGGLVGGASLVAPDFVEIIKALKK